MNNRNIGIYKITNLINNKFYIGSSSDLKKRLYEHRRELNLGVHANKHLQSAWNKYGEENFKFEVIETIESTLCTNKYLRDLETKYIQEFKCYEDSIGYNFIPGGIGTLNLPCSEEKKKKISNANKGKPVDIYSITGEYLETLGSVKEVVEKYKVAKNTITDSCKNRRASKKYIFKYHNIEENSNIITPEKIYTKNKTCGENKFSIYDINNNLLFECKYKKDVVFYLTGSEKRNGNIERKLKLCVENGDSICLYNKYIVKFINALNSGDAINAPRQLNTDDIEGTSNSANGEV